MFLLHRLVLTAFVGPCPEGMEACHNDGTRNNNHVDNLRWDTRTNNNLDKRKHGTAVGMPGETHPMSKLSNQDVVRIKEKLKQGGFKKKELAEMFHVSASTICDIDKGRRRKLL